MSIHALSSGIERTPIRRFGEGAIESGVTVTWLLDGSDAPQTIKPAPLFRPGIKPAFLQLAVDRAPTLSEADAKLIEGGALAHRATGLTMAVNTGPGPGLAQLAILAEHGVAADAWIWVHAQAAKEADLLAAAKQGAWISLDGLRERSVVRHVELALLMRAEGYWSQLLVSHDVGWFDPAKPAGETFRGYEILFTHFFPELRSAGVTETEISQLLVENPTKVFSAEKRLL